MDLKAVRSYLERNQDAEVPLEAFDLFFKSQLVSIMGVIQSSVISESQFAELVQEYEQKLI